MRTYKNLGEALMNMTETEANQTVPIVEVAYPQDELKTTVQEEAQAAADKAVDVVDVGNDIYAAVKQGANETIYTLSKSGTEVQTLKQRFDAMTPYGKAVTLIGIYLGAKALTKVINPAYAIGGAALYFVATKNK